MFNLFDDDQTGKISLMNLKRVAKELGETMTEPELMEMIERADTDQDGEISFEEFYAIMTKKVRVMPCRVFLFNSCASLVCRRLAQTVRSLPPAAIPCSPGVVSFPP